MQVKTYDVVYGINGKLERTECTNHSLQTYLDTFLQENGEILYIIAKNTKKKKSIDSNISEKQKYYRQNYDEIQKQYENHVITQKTRDNIIEKLKILKDECSTKDDFEKQFEMYKKTNNIL